MGKITDITIQRNGKRANIFIDGSYACGLELITVMSAGLKTGEEISREALEKLQIKSESEQAFNKAVQFLSTRRRTEKEIRNKLREKGYLAGVTDAVINKLCEYGYIDDERFAEDYINTYVDRTGEMKIRFELRRLGIDNRIIDEKLSAIDRQTKLESAVSAAEKYLRSHDFDKIKLSRHLAGKGYGYDLINEAVRMVQAEATT